MSSGLFASLEVGRVDGRRGGEVGVGGVSIGGGEERDEAAAVAESVARPF